MGIKRRDVLGMTLGLGGALATYHIRRSLAEPSTESSTGLSEAEPALDQAVSEGTADLAVSRTSAAPAPAGMDAPRRGDLRFVVFSDINGSYRSTDYIRQVNEAIPLIPDWQPDLVICAGDMVAGQLLSLTRPEVQAMWDGFDRHVFQPIRSAGLPFALTIGNHDASNHIQHGKYVFDLEREMANAYWNTPGRDLGIEFVDRVGFPFYYSFMHRGVFYLTWDASSANVADEQVAWADRALASPEAQNAPMRVVVGHLPFYAISQGRDRMGEILNRPDELRSLLERHNVHLYISGHHHAYYPGHVDSGLNFLHCGALGSGPRTWLDTINASIHTLTVVDIDFDRNPSAGQLAPTLRYTTYDMTSKQRIDESQLPRVIVGPTGRIWRHDLAWSDLSAEEQTRPHRPSD